MKLLLIPLISTFLFSAVNQSNAQTLLPQGKIAGIIADSATRSPAEFATIYLKTGKDNLLKKA